MTITREEVTQLYAPFPLDAHSIREGHKVSGGKKIEWFVYLDRMAIQQRLDELFPGEWEAIYLAHATDGDISTVYLSIAIRGLRRDFNGTGKPHRARDSEEEGVDENSPKGAMTDAFRRAASLWGLGAYLWELPHIYTESYPGGDWDAKRARENEAQQKFADWYKRQFGAVAATGQMRNMDAPPADDPPPAPAQPKGTQRQRSPYTANKPVSQTAAWELNDASEGVLIMQVKNALPNEAPPHVVNAVKKMRANGEFAACVTFADAVALAVAHFNKPNMDVAF